MTTSGATLSLLEKATGGPLCPGTLNVELDKPISVESGSKTVVRDESGVRTNIFIKPILIGKWHAHIVRSEATENGLGRHSRRVVEVVSVHNLRQMLNLNDNDVVELQL